MRFNTSGSLLDKKHRASRTQSVRRLRCELAAVERLAEGTRRSATSGIHALQESIGISVVEKSSRRAQSFNKSCNPWMSVDKHVQESLHTSADRDSKVLSGAQQEIAFLKSQTQQQRRQQQTLQMDQEKRDDEVKQLQRSCSLPMMRTSYIGEDVERLKADFQKHSDES